MATAGTMHGGGIATLRGAGLPPTADSLPRERPDPERDVPIPYPQSHESDMLHQLIGLVGALLVLGAYLALQRRWLTLEQRVYHALNLVGAGLLAWIAATERQVGLTLVEGAWALLSLPGVLRPPRPSP